MNKPKLLFLTGSFDGTGKEAAKLNSLMKTALEERFEVEFVSENKECVLESKKKGVKVLYIYDFLKKISVKDVPGELAKFEREYSFCAEKILFGDNDYSSIQRDRAMEDMLKMFYFWESLFRQKHYSLVLGGGVRYSGLIPHIILRNQKDTIFLGLSFSPFPGKFCLSEDNYGRYTLLDQYYRKKRIFLTAEEQKDVSELISKYTFGINSTKIQQEYAPKISFRKIKYLLNRINTSRIEKDSPYLNVSRGVKRYFLRLWRKNYFKIRARTLYGLPRNESFFYLPLQTHDDSTRLVWLNFIESQLSVIKSISRSLPANCYLYVKEHPGAIGDTKVYKLKKIKAVPKVRLISPFISGRKLISDSKGLITLSGTSGIEALVLKKPVILLGRAYYDFPELVWRVRNFEELDEVLSSVYHYPRLPAENRVKHFLGAYRKSCYKGRFCMNQYYYSNKVDNSLVLSSENAKDLADGIYQSYLLALGKKK